MKRLMNVVLWLSLTTVVFAETPAVTSPAFNLDNAKTKSATCVACHGADGNGIAPNFPKIAGQHALYIEKQLQEFKSGARANPIMMGMVAGLSTEDMHDLAVYFSQQKMTSGTADPSLVAKGEALYRGGDRGRGIAACTACHGPQGDGNNGAKFPHLSGQYAVYTDAQLKAYRDGTRKNGSKMTDIAKLLTDEDIAALASYIEGLH